MKAIQMPTAKEVVGELQPLGSEGYRKVLRNDPLNADIRDRPVQYIRNHNDLDDGEHRSHAQ